jgi:hypothetical protein
MSAEQIDEKVEAERLRHIRALIEELLREADVCANVVLAGKGGRFEIFSHLRASWSNARLDTSPEGDGIRLTSKAADYGGDTERQQQHLAWTVGMIGGIAEFVGKTALMFLHCAQHFDQKTGATHVRLPRDDPRDPRGRRG